MMQTIYKIIKAVTVMGVLWLSGLQSVLAEERVALVIQAQGSQNFIESLYSGALHAGKIHDYEIDVHQLSLTQSRPKKWLEEILKKQPKAIIIVDTPISSYTEDLLEAALRKNIMTGIVNANIAVDYFGAIFRIGSGKIVEGEAAGKYLKTHAGQSVMCINYVDGIANNTARCQGIANGIEHRIYQINSDGNIAGITKGVADFLEYFPQGGYVIVTSDHLLDALLNVRQQARKQKGHDFKIGFVGIGGNHLPDYLLKKDVAFMVTDQPWMQGYWAVSSIALRDVFKLQPEELVSVGAAVIDAVLAKRIKEGQKIVSLPVVPEKVRRRADDDAVYPGVPALRLKK